MTTAPLPRGDLAAGTVSRLEHAEQSHTQAHPGTPAATPSDGDAIIRMTPGQIRKALAPFRVSSYAAAIWQLSFTFILLGAMLWLMWIGVTAGHWYAMLLAAPAGAMLVRLFIFQHDCGHGSFFASRRANHIVGTLLSVFTLTPYYWWRRSHAQHHATHGDLDHRGEGDVHTLTVREYEALSSFEKLKYRLYRHPLVMFGLFPTLLFVVRHRFTLGTPKDHTRERLSIWFTNLMVAATLAGAAWLGGVDAMLTLLIIWLPTIIFAATIGIWMFYVQHQFDPNYWQRHEQWDRVHASLRGSSYYRLPWLLRWATGNIGLHHIHHLDSRIPNYQLQACLEANRELLDIPPLTMLASLRCVSLKLWDEDAQTMVGFEALRRRQGGPA